MTTATTLLLRLRTSSKFGLRDFIIEDEVVCVPILCLIIILACIILACTMHAAVKIYLAFVLYLEVFMSIAMYVCCATTCFKN